jgi:hypothetical protein
MKISLKIVRSSSGLTPGGVLAIFEGAGFSGLEGRMSRRVLRSSELQHKLTS